MASMYNNLIGEVDWGTKCDSKGFIKRLLSAASGECLYCTGEGHFDKTRAAASESTMLAEVEIALNGPVLVEADEVIEEAIDRYFKGKRWHFIKRDIRDYTKDSNA